MKRIAIILGLLMLAQSAFAGGTVLFMNGGSYDGNPYQQQQSLPLDPNATLYTQDGVYGAIGNATSSTQTTRKFRLGRQSYNDPQVYWNFGRVNFGNGFTTVGGGDKKF
jgi:hypothetical protein